jgi:hypothetical protein
MQVKFYILTGSIDNHNLPYSTKKNQKLLKQPKEEKIIKIGKHFLRIGQQMKQ